MPRIADLLLVALGGAVGSNARYLVGTWLAALLGATFPWGTLAVNLTGSFTAGLILGIADARGLAAGARLLLVTGFLGGYTTFSAFSVESVRLAEQQGILIAAANVLGSVGFGLAAAVGGLALGRGL
jgi:CrcB protein